MIRWGLFTSTFILLIVALSCSGSSSPVLPDMGEKPSLTGTANNIYQNTSTHLWGIWDVWVDPSSGSIEFAPLRGMAFTANVSQFVDGPPTNLVISIVSIEPEGDYTDITVDVGIKHPFPGLDMYTGFDVMGVFMTNGSDAYPGPDGFAIPGINDQILLNEDGYSRWFNAVEFEAAGSIQPLLGYTPGNIGSPGYFPTAELCGFKYFADNLTKHQDPFIFLSSNPTARGRFNPGSINFRRYNLRFPASTGIKFQYSVIAHWEDPGTDAPILDDFPISANADEALVFDVVDSSTVYFVDPDTNGGYIELDITPWDWTAATSDVMDEYVIRCYSDAWSGPFEVDMTPTVFSEFHYTYNALITPETIPSADPIPVWIEVSYPDYDYSNDFGVPNNADGLLAGYYRYDVPVESDVQPYFELKLPNGGEKWAPGTNHPVKWDSYNVAGNIEVLYSKDNFVTDVNLVAGNEINDGYYLWQNIPDDPSDTVLVRVRSSLDPTVYDDSDDYFTILDPAFPWINVEQPNDGEEWEVASWHWILWDSDQVSGNISIEYSKDDFVADINVIVADTVNDGGYLWNPIPNDESDTCKVRISSVDDPSVWNVSDDYFSIVPPGNPWINVLIPNGGQAWVVGSAHEISWEAYNLNDDLKLEYSKDNFTSPGILIIASTENDGNYMWDPIPNDVSTTVRVKISAVSNGNINDVSDGDFSIVAAATPWIEVLIPNGGQQWMVGTAHEVLWDSDNVTGNVDILYSKDNFTTDIHSISSGTANDGAHMWNPIPNDSSDTVRVRVRSTSTPTILDDSDANFSIVDTGGGWARHWGWTNNDYSYAVSSDDAGNVLVGGSFEGTVDFDPSRMLKKSIIYGNRRGQPQGVAPTTIET